ncbi:flavin-containing monooxygenase [Hyphomonas sp.]|uniref:flavin-containing monooxygenase n=1 Tax=Hyphomonas sp. TaxID=87 RepID=UPI003526EDFF
MIHASLDKETIRRKYSEERKKRLRPDGNAQYVRLEDVLKDLAGDPYTPWTEREPARDHVTFAFVGGGFAGLVVGARLKEAGIKDFRLIEKGGDVGGTWYWNRYPGARCDTAAMIYLPLLEETGYIPTEKYVRGPEIRAHCQRIANQYGLYEKALLHTEVTALEWLQEAGVWRITTDRGDDFTAKYIGMGTGPLHVAKLPGIPGIETFNGKAFHTSRWDYGYTGGNPDNGHLGNLANKRVAIIGTGATGVQCIPPLARSSGQLYVFQRTPSSVDERHNHPIDPDWFATIATPGWQKRWLDNFVDNQGRGIPEEDLIDDGWTEISRRIRTKIFSLPPELMNPAGFQAAFEEADIEKMEQIRSRVDYIVEDPLTAENLKAWYSQLCKRPCFSDEYLPAFNLPNTKLVDTNGKGVERITETGVVANGQLYEVDCIIFASGFEYGASLELKTGYDLRGRGGRMLSEHWANGLRTLHGLHMHGFPNAFMVQMNQGANMVTNIPHNIVDHAQTIAQIVSYVEQKGYSEVEPTLAAEAGWIELILSGQGSLFGSPDCTPGYYNNEGQGFDKAYRQTLGHPGGPKAFFEHMEHWRKAGNFDGLSFR